MTQKGDIIDFSNNYTLLLCFNVKGNDAPRIYAGPKMRLKD